MIVYPITKDCMAIEIHTPITQTARKQLSKIISQMIKKSIAEIRIKNVTKIVERVY